MDIVQFLQEFSVTPADFSDLSELFSDDKRMAEAAVRALTGSTLLRCLYNADAAASRHESAILAFGAEVALAST